MTTEIQVCRETLRRVLLALRPPADQPGYEEALRATAAALVALGQSLERPTPWLQDLIAEMQAFMGPLQPASGLLHRRLSRYASWRLLLSLPRDVTVDILAAIGAEIARAVLEGRSVPERRADALRRACEPGGAEAASPLINAILLDARSRFSIAVAGSEPTSQLDRLRAFYRALAHYEGNHAHQARRDHRTLAGPAFRIAAEQLRARCEQGETAAVLMATQAATGLNLALTRELPLRPSLDDAWGATLDVESGIYLLDLETVAANARRMSRQGCVPASAILVKPLPEFLSRALLRRRECVPDALTLDELLERPDVSERDLVTEQEYANGLRPSLARFCGTTEIEAVEAGVNRVVAGHLSGRYQTATRSKRYYALINREALWEAARVYYERIGWGSPVPLASGIAIGAQAVPTDDAIRGWHAWMTLQVESTEPGRNGGLSRLVAHHNAIARASASIVSCCVALRECRVIPLLADIELQGGPTGVLDKRSPSPWAPDGRSAGPHLLALPLVARYQIELYIRHSGALAHRLRRFPAYVAAADHLVRIARREAVGLFVGIDSQGSVTALGSADLTRWWSPKARFAANWPRAFWQTRLLERGVPSRAIDRLLRHVSSGERPLSSDGGDGLADELRLVAQAQQAELVRLGIEPIAGLVR